jgi:biopolymer transport protein ExbB
MPMSASALFEQGGWVMYPLALTSLAGLACAAYCALTLRRRAVLRPALEEVAATLTPDGDCEGALAVCREEGGPFGELLSLTIQTRTATKAEAEALVEGAGRRAMHELSRGLLGLEVVSGVAPLLGLLGTVSGMYQLLTRIAEAGVKEIGLISGGIAEALVTTMVGLVIGIPAYVAYVGFSRKADELVLAMEEYATHLLARLGGRKG